MDPRETSPCRIHHLSIEYPEEWATPLNPHAQRVERDVEDWLRRIGVVRDPRAEQVFRRLHVAGYGGWPFGRATRHRLETVTRFLALWIFYDDGIEGAGEPREEALGQAIRGEPGADLLGDPCLRGWWETARRYRAVMSAAWLERHAAGFLAWARAVREEAAQVEAQRRGSVPTMAEYLAVRAVGVGLLPTLNFIEYDLGQELPDEVLRHPAMQEVGRHAALAVGIFNDLLAFSKDREAGWVNVVTSIAAERRCGLGHAFARAVALHNRCVFRVLAAGERLLAETCAQGICWPGRAWLARLHALVIGLARWQEEAPRYRLVHRVGAGEEVRLEVPWGAAGAAGLLLAG
jgi:hypothetical protein